MKLLKVIMRIKKQGFCFLFITLFIYSIWNFASIIGFAKANMMIPQINQTENYSFEISSPVAFPGTVITNKNSNSPFATTQNAFWVSDSSHSLAGQCT